LTRAPPGVVRIIGGRWRGSKLPVAEVAGLRPTADRVRETLFNWLQPHLAGAIVLDLFAGTGALGLEAASRGAGSVVLIERDPALAASLRASAARLIGTDATPVVEVVCDDALHWLAQEQSGHGERPSGSQPTFDLARFDLVLVDPPFAAALWQPAVAALTPWLAADAWLYLESPREGGFVPVDGWFLHREGSTRDVRFALYRRGTVTLANESAEQDPARA